MKTYILIKIYPGSPLLNTILEINPDMVFAYLKGVISTTKVSDILQYPEYWEEIIEKDYKILSFRQDTQVTDLWLPDKLKGEGYWSRDGYITVPYTTNQILNHDMYEIYSVKRLSDGEIFTIGDNVIFNAKSGSILKGPIIQFRIDTKFGIIVDYRDNSKGVGQHWNYLNNAEKSKQPLFTTEDGVDIFEGDWYEYVHKHSWSRSCAKANKDFYEQDKYSNNSLYFSTTEKAQEYIDLHKPKYSINDLNNASKIVNTQIFKGYVSMEMLLFNLGIELKKLNK